MFAPADLALAVISEFCSSHVAVVTSLAAGLALAVIGEHLQQLMLQ